MEKLVSETLSNAMDEMSMRFFWMNKKLDRMKAVLSVKFTMPLFSDLVHLELAHKYPLLADNINDIEDEFNIDYFYLGVEGATEEYSSVVDMMKQLLDWTIETNDQLNELINLSKLEHCYNVFWKLGEVSLEYSKYVANAILLYDKAVSYGDNISKMDSDSQKWFKL